MRRYTKTELRLLAACFAAYMAAYISRCNLSPSLDAIAQTFCVSAAQAGMLPTFFAGFLSDRFGWSAVFVSWAVLSLAGTLTLKAARRGD